MPKAVVRVRRRDRLCGSGWLDCPNCHEHAAQDVVDDVGTLTLLGYGLTPVSRRRLLVCRRCGFRRPRTPEEMRRLDTAGTPLRRPRLVPTGLLGIAAVVGLIVAVAALSNAGNQARANTAITYSEQSAGAVAPLSFQGPSAWTYAVSGDHNDRYNAATNDASFFFRRLPDQHDPAAILGEHFRDEIGFINAQGVPDCVSSGGTMKIGADKSIEAASTNFKYRRNGVDTTRTIYTFAHQGVGYLLVLEGSGDGQRVIKSVTDSVTGTLRFTGNEATPTGGATSSSSATAASSETASSGGSSSATSESSSCSTSSSGSDTATGSGSSHGSSSGSSTGSGG